MNAGGDLKGNAFQNGGALKKFQKFPEISLKKFNLCLWVSTLRKSAFSLV